MAVREKRSYFFATGFSDRLKAVDMPSELTFRRLTESAAFIAESDDRAKEGSQGLVKMVTDFQAKSNTEPDVVWSYAPRVRHLPTSVAASQIFESYVGNMVDVVKDASIATRNEYIITINSSFSSHLANRFSTIDNNITTASNSADQAATDAAQAATDAASADTKADTGITNAASAQTTANTAVTNAATAQSAADAAASVAASAQSDALEGIMLGEMKFYTSITMPSTKWLLCDGQAVSRTTYSDLFTLVSTTFGVGDGATTFNLPDAGQRALMGFKAVTSEFDIADTNGQNSYTIADSNLPEHSHAISAGAGGDITAAAGAATTTAAAGDGGAVVGTLALSGSTANNITTNTAIDNRPEYLAVPVIIRVLA